MVTIEDYRKYFEHQYNSHPALNAGAADSSGFQVVSIEEALGEFRSGVKSDQTFMRLVNYSYVVNDNSHEAQKMCQGVFLILKNFSSRAEKSDKYFQAMNDTNIIVDDIISKMMNDSRVGHTLFYNSLNRAEGFSVTPREYYGDGCCGWIVSFRFNNFFNDCPDNAPAWTDGGVTPAIL